MRPDYRQLKKRRPCDYAAVLVLLALLLLSAACWRLSGPDTSPCARVRPDPDFNQLFTRSGNGWTGGDGTLSVALPDGRTLWLFGDTFLGQVRPDGSRPADSPLIRNCLVIQDGQTLVTRHGGTPHDPSAFLDAPDPDTWYWPADGTVRGDRLWIFFHRFHQVSSGLWGWAWDGTVLATLRLPDLVLEDVIPISDSNGVAYGVALLELDDWLYIFGTEQRATIKHLHVARVSRKDPAASWQYWSGRHWSAEAGDSRAALNGVGSQFGVVRLERGLGLVTMDQRRPFSNRLVLYVAEAPTGPWRGPSEIHRAPEADADVAAYNPFVHTQFNRPEGHLISYNVNHVHDPEPLYTDAGIYRPRFIRADLACLAARIRQMD